MTLSKYGSFSAFANTFQSGNITKYKEQFGVDRMILSESAPTLTVAKHTYGKENINSLVVTYLLQSAIMLGDKTATQEQMMNIADIFVAEAGDLKITEVMLFFYWFMTGGYRDRYGNDEGKMYGAINGQTIMSCLPNFRAKRSAVIDNHNADSHNIKYEDMMKSATRCPAEVKEKLTALYGHYGISDANPSKAESKEEDYNREENERKLYAMLTPEQRRELNIG